MKNLPVFIGIAIIGLLGLGVMGWELGLFQTRGQPVIVVVDKGTRFLHLAHHLKEQGVIRNERALRWYLNLFGGGKLKRGEFELYENMSIPSVVSTLTSGKPLEHKFTVPEGYNIYQIADLLEEKGFGKREAFLAAAHSIEVTKNIPTLTPGAPVNSIEGYIFPDTYMIQRIFTEKEIAAMMVARFREVYNGMKQAFEASEVTRGLGLTPHQVITLASIVEKETGAASERPVIASVFLNRLKKHMRLQTDPTVIYGIWARDGRFDGNIHRRDLTTPTPYNTYVINGLPPGPIASPGQQAIQAVLNPSASEYLFFVSKNDGTHEFTSDFRSHTRAVKELQLNPISRTGKSWRNLPKKLRAN